VECQLQHTDLRRAFLRGAHLTGAKARYTHFDGACMQDAHLEGARLERVFFSNENNCAGLTLASEERCAVVADINWDGANLAVINWSQVRRLGDDQRAQQSRTDDEKRKSYATRRQEYEIAMRANRRLSLILHSQGLNEHADRFAYRALKLQRIAFRRRNNALRYLGSLFLDLISGYGYRPIRSLIA
jgi:hypothetical protein